MIFSRSSLLGLAVILASSCATLERLVPNEQADVENQTQEQALPDSVTPISKNELKERELNLQAKKNSTSKEENTELKEKIQSLEAQLIRQEKAFAELQDQWTTNFSLMEKAVSETLRENQQLIAELQQSVEAIPNTIVASEQPQLR
ncbi:MAG: hypothetical protein ACPGD6_10035, partial [bacterium]